MSAQEITSAATKERRNDAKNIFLRCNNNNQIAKYKKFEKQQQ